VLKAEKEDEAFKAGKLAVAANTAGNAPKHASPVNEEEKKIEDMKARARSLLLNMKETREAPAGGEEDIYGYAVGGGRLTTTAASAAKLKEKISKSKSVMSREEVGLALSTLFCS
jgi:hypothetical protein